MRRCTITIAIKILALYDSTGSLWSTTGLKEMKIQIPEIIQTLKKFSAIDPEMPIAQMLLLLEVALAGESGASLTEISAKHGMGQANTSRNLSQLGKINRKHEAGHQLIDAVENPMDRRFKILTLTKSGKLFIKDLLRDD